MRQLLLRNKPVPQRRCIVVPTDSVVAEPSVVQYKCVDSQSFAVMDDIKDLLLVKVEIGSLPVVDHNGAAGAPARESDLNCV